MTPRPGTGDFKGFGGGLDLFLKVVEEVTNSTSLKLNELMLDLYVMFFFFQKLEMTCFFEMWAIFGLSMLNFRAKKMKR